MIDLNLIAGYFPPALRENPSYAKHMVKEYIQLMVLDFLSKTPYIRKMTFIGGTNLRLIKGIDRFSEDLDFDIKDMSKEEFRQMATEVVEFLKRSGLNAEPRDKDNPKLTAFRSSIHFPQLLFDLGLTGHREERFLLKIEAQDQGINYVPQMVNVNRCGFFFSLPVPPDSILLSMKLSALLARAKGRDFYDTMFLLQHTMPEYDFLKAKTGIGSEQDLREAFEEVLTKTDLNIKKRDFEHLMFDSGKTDIILRFQEFINEKLPNK